MVEVSSAIALGTVAHGEGWGGIKILKIQKWTRIIIVINIISIN